MSQVLIHIGYPKTGSTYLQHWFLGHPEMLYRSSGIAGFNDAREIARLAEKQLTLPPCYVLSCEDLSVWKGDFSVFDFEWRGYDLQAYHLRLVQCLHDIFPSAKILIVTRGFSAMLKSLYSQYVRSGGILTFSELDAAYGRHFGTSYDYGWLIELYRKTFGEANVIVMPFELLHDTPSAFLEYLENQMGIMNHFRGKEEKINPSLKPKALSAVRRLSKFIFKSLGIFSVPVQTKLFSYHIGWLKGVDQSLLIRALSLFCPAENIIVENFMLERFKGKAEILRREEFFQPYLKYYLLE